jgi:DNA-binding transcriptional LysR family regulator
MFPHKEGEPMQRLIEVRLLVAIVTLSEELNFTRAAKRLGNTQPGLSRRVASLENRYRVKLFERDHANVYLTEAGRVFVEEAKLSLLHDEKAIEVAKAATEGVESVLTIGRSPYADPFLTSALLSVHLPLYPNLNVHLHSDFAPDLVHDLTVSKLDLALVANPGANRKLTTTKVSESPLYVVLPETNALASKECVTLSDLRDERWILFERKAHPDIYDAILRRAAEEEIVFRNGQKVLTAEDAAQLVSENLGIAFVSMPGALRIAERGALVRPLEDKELLLTVCLATRADNRSKLLSEFVRAFMRRLSQIKKPPQRVEIPQPLKRVSEPAWFSGSR